MRLYHNPRCSKSRQAVQLLREAGFQFEEYRYLQLGIAPEDLEVLSTVQGIVRKNDVQGGIIVSDLTSTEIKELFEKDPHCMERPVLIFNGQAILGRPPELIIDSLRNQ
tara:strand:- start:96 stop:422 length:327 start_codon:yes stop_codon:yes gene_type:complete